MQKYNFNLQQIETYAQQIFLMHDRDRSGSLDIMEFPEMCKTFFWHLGLQPPSQMDVMFLMNTFDSNHDGRISYAEFRNMLYYIGGQKQNTGR
jgi:Ca2+-binding EF-hand superfamily protein